MEERMHSKFLRDFIKEITWYNRNPKNTDALELLDELVSNPEIIIEPESKVYRARVVRDRDKIKPEGDFYGFDAQGSFVPPRESSRDMRANYRYIPYLYCSNDPYVALVEVRPRFNAVVSMATIIVDQELRLLDFTNSNRPTKKMEDKKINLFSDLSYLFSKPITDEDETEDYIPTQFIAEYAKNLGYDGLVYKSSLVPELNRLEVHPYNIVVFNYKRCRAIKSNLFRITGNHFDCQKEDSDPVIFEIKA